MWQYSLRFNSCARQCTIVFLAYAYTLKIRFFFKLIAEIKYLSLKTNSLFLLLGFTLSSSLLEMRLLTRSMTQGTTSNAYITKRAPRHIFLRKLHTVTGFSRRTAFFFIPTCITSVHLCIYTCSKLSQIKNCIISY